MKRSFARTALLATLIASMGTTSAHAADWIEQVRVKKGGVDLQPINVLSNGTNYTNIVQATHDFKLDVYARAKNGKRIWYAELSSDAIQPWGHAPTEPAVNQSDPHEIQNYAGRAVHAGSKRTWNRDLTYRIPLGRIVWQGPDPKEACNALLAKKLIEGQPRPVILSQVQKTEAKAKFFLRAAAARKNKAEELGESSRTVFDTVGSHWTDEGAGTQYTVKVRCLPSPDQNNQIQQQQPKPPAPNTAIYQPKPKSQDNLLRALPIIIGIGLAIAAGSGGSGRSGGR